MSKTVLLIEPTIRPNGVEYLTKNFNVAFAPNGLEETIIESINTHQANAVIIRTEKITENILKSCPSLEVVGMHGVGLDNIDVQSATENGVVVLNAPLSNYVSVAEHAIMSILSSSRNLKISDLKVRNNEWHFRESYFPMEVNGKTLLIVGMGRVGQELARKAKAFNMNILGFDPFCTKLEMELHGVYKIDDLNMNLPLCDFISLHAPLTDETFHMFSTPQFDLMKNSSYIINLGRGSLINEDALYQALINKQIAGASLDVLEQEPPNINNPLFELENVIFTPHFGGDTLEAKDRCSEFITQEVGLILNGKFSKSIVNPQVLGTAKALQKSI